MSTIQDFMAALIRTNPDLSKFNPLPRILFFDDFNQGANGWCELIGNHDGNLDNVRAVMADMRPPQISNCNFFDIGTHGAVHGTYSLKLATRPKSGHMAQAIKRMTQVKQGRVQFETWFTYKSEQVFDRPLHKGEREWDGNYDPSEANFGDFTISNDICEGEGGTRYHCALRYVNTNERGELVRKWMYKTSVQPTTKMVKAGMTPVNTDYHVIHPNDWEEVPGGFQPLCYNEVPTKINWHYLRWVFDTRIRRNVELQVNDRVFDLSDIPVPTYGHGYEGINKLMNFCVDVRTLKNIRNFLYFDSILVSTEE